MKLRPLSPGEAAPRLAGLARLDPRGLLREADIDAICRDGACVGVSDETGAAVIVLQVANGVAWIDAAGGGGGVNLCPAIEAAAAAMPGVRAVGFQTMRRGLVRRGLQQGFRVTGYVLRKDL